MADTFEFSREEDGSLSPASAVYQAIGAASMAWKTVPAGVFDDAHAKAVADALMVELGLAL